MSSYSLFDVVGPVMHGPSSNHTGGAVRLGYYYRQIIGGLPQNITFIFHPFLMKFYKGHGTHLALMAGCLGMREDDLRVNNSQKYMDEKHITVNYEATDEKDPDRNLMRIKTRFENVDWVINGISIGGGNIVINNINEMETKITGNTYLYFYLLKKVQDLGTIRENIIVDDVNEKTIPEGHLIYISTMHPLTKDQIKFIELTFQNNIILKRYVKPLHPFSEKINKDPLFKNFDQLEELCKSNDIAEVAIAYEMDRSKTTREQIMREAHRIVDTEEIAINQGLKGNVPLIGGFIGNSDGKLVAEWSQTNKTIIGETFSMALARAIAVAEISASGGIIVAVPTCGSAGTLPGILFSVAQRFNKNKETLAKAFLIAAALGTIVGNKSTFSGSIGGCQVEVGVGAAIGAGAAVWLAGGDFQKIKNAFAITLKNVLGLTCDQPVSPVEVPCVKRNAMGVSVGFMGAELALAGIKSAIPPDQVIDALVDTAKRIPNELKCSAIGGLASVSNAKDMQKQWNEKIEAKNKNNK